MKVFELQFIIFITFINCYSGRCLSFGTSEPVNYCEESSATGTCQSDVKLFVASLSSEGSLIPYEYNHFDFCAAAEPLSRFPLDGPSEVKLSPYKISFKKDVDFAVLCQKTYDLKNVDDISKLRILQEGMLKKYQHHWLVDSIPVTRCHHVEGVCSTYFPIGCYVDTDGKLDDACIGNTRFNKPDTFYLLNHIEIDIKYHTGEDESWGVGFKDKGGRIISVEVEPRSLSSLQPGCSYDTCNMEIPNDLKANTLTINYTYSVTFTEDNTVKWSSRWDNIFQSLRIRTNGKFQWLTLLHSFGIVLFLSAIVAFIFFHTICKSQAETVGNVQNNFVWKLAYEDVFRPPQKLMLFSVMIGCGVQIFLTSLFTFLFVWFGFQSLDKRGALSMALYAFLGNIAGYVAARMYKAFGGIQVHWSTNMLLTAMLCPVLIFLLNLAAICIFWSKGIYFTKQLICLVLTLILWLSVIALQMITGAYYGFKRTKVGNPVQTKEISKQIPGWKFYGRRISGIILGGTFPFGCILVQLFLLLNGIWHFEVYYTLGSLLFVFMMLVITCSEVAIIMCYFHLRAGDCYWWWHSFASSSLSGFLVFSCCIYFYCTKINFSDAASTFLYFAWALLVVTLYILMTGTIGFCASYWYIKRTYREIKVIPLQNWRKQAFAINLCSNEKLNPDILKDSKKIGYHVLQNEC